MFLVFSFVRSFVPAVSAVQIKVFSTTSRRQFAIQIKVFSTTGRRQHPPAILRKEIIKSLRMQRQWLVPVQARTVMNRNIYGTFVAQLWPSAGRRGRKPPLQLVERKAAAANWHTDCVRHTAKQAKHRCKGVHRSDHQTSKPPTGRPCLTSSGGALSVVLSVRLFLLDAITTAFLCFCFWKKIWQGI
jgi:hypothetical protein